MLRKEFMKRIFLLNTAKRCSSSQINLDKLEKDSAVEVVEDDNARLHEAEIERKRNKSRLKDSDRNFLFERRPYVEPTHWTQGTVKYMRRLYGRYGEASGINPTLCWPVREELQESREYERVAHPFTVAQMVEEARQRRDQEREELRVRQEDIVRKMEKLEGWKRDLYERIARKEAEAVEAKERKQRLMEEVRMHFGYTVDPKEEKFKQLLEKKEKEQKKVLKEERRKAREEQLMNKLLSKKVRKPADEAEESKPENKLGDEDDKR